MIKLDKRIVGIAGTLLVSLVVVTGLHLNKSDASPQEETTVTTNPVKITPTTIEPEVPKVVVNKEDETVVSNETAPPVVEQANIPEPPPKPADKIVEPAQPSPVTVVSYQVIQLEGEDQDCVYTYSDGSTYRFEWKRILPGDKKVTRYIGTCSQVSIGKLKAS